MRCLLEVLDTRKTTFGPGFRFFSLLTCHGEPTGGTGILQTSIGGRLLVPTGAWPEGLAPLGRPDYGAKRQSRLARPLGGGGATGPVSGLSVALCRSPSLDARRLILTASTALTMTLRQLRRCFDARRGDVAVFNGNIAVTHDPAKESRCFDANNPEWSQLMKHGIGSSESSSQLSANSNV